MTVNVLTRFDPEIVIVLCFFAFDRLECVLVF